MQLLFVLVLWVGDELRAVKVHVFACAQEKATIKRFIKQREDRNKGFKVLHLWFHLISFFLNESFAHVREADSRVV